MNKILPFILFGIGGVILATQNAEATRPSRISVDEEVVIYAVSTTDGNPGVFPQCIRQQLQPDKNQRQHGNRIQLPGIRRNVHIHWNRLRDKKHQLRQRIRHQSDCWRRWKRTLELHIHARQGRQQNFHLWNGGIRHGLRCHIKENIRMVQSRLIWL